MKKLLLLLVLVLICTLLFACAKKTEPDVTNNNEESQEIAQVETQTEEQDENEEEDFVLPVADEAVYAKYRINYNGIELGVLDKFDDVKDGLGKESRPSQTYTPCGAMVEGEVTTHYYEGLTLETNSQGIIYTIKFTSMDNPNSTASLVTGVKLGSSHEEVVNAYGFTDSDDEYNTTYSYDKLYVGFSYDVDNSGDVNYFSIESAV